MLRSFYASLLALALVTSAAAQTAPAQKATKTTTRPTGTKTRTTSRSTTMQSRSASRPVAGTRDDIGPGGNGAVGSTEGADSKGQNVYAAPGMPVNVDNPKKVEGYNGPAPTRSRTGTTLSPR